MNKNFKSAVDWLSKNPSKWDQYYWVKHQDELITVFDKRHHKVDEFKSFCLGGIAAALSDEILIIDSEFGVVYDTEMNSTPISKWAYKHLGIREIALYQWPVVERSTEAILEFFNLFWDKYNQ